MNLKRIMAHAFARRIAYLVVAALIGLGLSLFAPEARAQSYPDCTNYSVRTAECKDRGAATSAVRAHVTQYKGTFSPEYPYNQVCLTTDTTLKQVYGSLIADSCEGWPDPASGWSRSYPVECETGQWNEETESCDAPCDQKDPIANKMVRGSVGFCSEGCSFEQYEPGGITVCLGEGAGMVCAGKEWRPTGQTCAVGDASEPYDPNKSICRTIPGAGFSECVKPNGDHCVTGAKGTVMCWKPGEQGPRVPDHGLEAGNKGESGSDPNAPSNVNDPSKTGSSTTTINNSSSTTNVFTGSGNSGGQHDTGEGGSGPGQGSGVPGQGGGGGGGGGDGDGNGPGGPGQGFGTLYQGADKSIGSVYAGFQARVGNAPLIGAVTSYLTVPSGGGCPSFDLAGTDFWPAMSFDYHCQGAFASALALCGFVVLAIAGFAAFRIAFY